MLIQVSLHREPPEVGSVETLSGTLCVPSLHRGVIYRYGNFLNLLPVVLLLHTGTVFTLTVERVLTVYTWQTEVWRDAVVVSQAQTLYPTLLAEITNI